MKDGLFLENEDLEALVTEATDAFLDRVQQGEPVDVAAFSQGYPKIADILRDLLPAMQVMQRPSSIASGRLGVAVDGQGALGNLGDFRLKREIGRGGMGIVYEAEQLSLGRRVALKILPMAAALDPRHLQRFRLEAQAAAQLHHPHIVPIHSVGNERGVYYYAMQYVEGQSLAEVIAQLQKQGQEEAAAPPASTLIFKRETGADPREDVAPELPGAADTTIQSIRSLAYFRSVVQLIIQAAEALEYAHDMGVIHRDIKPANLLRDAQGNLYVTDFGLAQLKGVTGLTRTGDLVGTLRYMSPEQVLSKHSLDQRTDVYSLGATLYELLTLTPAFDATERPLLLRQIAEEEPWPPRFRNSAIPVDLETIVLKAMAKEPERRYGTAKELADDLRRYLEDQPIKARRPTTLERLAKWSRRHRAVVIAAVAGVLLAVLGGLVIGTTLLAYEQQKTQKALLLATAEEKRAKQARDDAEAQRDHSKDLFLMALNQVDFLAELCDTELKDKPELQELRRKVLESLLKYYQDFINQSKDDPELYEELLVSSLHEALIQADFGAPDKAREALERARPVAEKLGHSHPNHPSLVAFHKTTSSICNQIGSAQGSRELQMLSNPAVQTDLKLTPEQLKKIGQLAEKRRDPFNKGRIPSHEEWRAKFEELSGQEKALKGLLQPEQAKRLKQIALQQRGVEAFNDAAVANALQLTEDQKHKIRSIQEGRHHPMPTSPRPGFSRPDFRKGSGTPRSPQEQILSVLTTTQKERWQDLIGPPFQGDLRAVGHSKPEPLTMLLKGLIRLPRGKPDPRNPMPPRMGRKP